ncbi:low molecular weight protein-tyrosine-phosphatase [Tsuneonella sp. SYSU-LHT278]|uniref:low molecular weight protein-tyrosine-phosphatase n=1 Tax=Tsuneonella sediminis TaxID=3416089 RepID=UPI003F79E33C
MTTARPAVLLVCLGNICRSPLAEAAMRAEARRAGLPIEIDSAGTGDWHVGKPPDPRAQAVAREAGVDIAGMRARQVVADDFRRFTHILAMDAQNLADLRAIMPEDATAHVSLLLDMVPGREGASVRDPYYGGEELFEDTWADVTAAARALVRQLAD